MAHDGTTKSTEAETHLYEMIDDLDICMLTTVEKDGQLHSRPMGNQSVDESGEIWFFTDRDGALASEVKGNPRLSLAYSNASGRHATVSGKGEMVDDRAMIEARWTEDMKAWFPKGKTDPNLALLRVRPERGEYWDAGSSTVVSALAYVKAKVTGAKGDDLVDNAKVPLK